MSDSLPVEIQRRIQSFANNYLRLPRPAGWSFVTSEGGEVSISFPETKIGAVATGGRVHVQKDGTNQVHKLNYAGIGGSLGLQLVPSPINFTFSLTQMPSFGVVYTGPLTGRALTLNEFYGPCLMYEASAQAGPGWGGVLMFMGASRMASLAPLALQPPAILLSCRAIVAFQGASATVLPGGFGGAVALCEIF